MKRELIYAAAVGGCVGALMTIALGLVVPLAAQNESPTDWKDGYFNEITCRSLRVVDEDPLTGLFETEITPGSTVASQLGGKTKTEINATGVTIGQDVKINFLGVVITYEDGRSVGVSPIGVYLRGDGAEASMTIGEHGGRVVVEGKNHQRRAMMLIDEAGGHVRVQGKDKGGASMVVVDIGGRVDVYAKDGQEASMNVEENGGRVDVYGKGSNSSRATIGVDEYGRGAVNTWDKNGYRLATLK